MKRILASILLASAVVSAAAADEPVTAKTILDKAFANAQSIAGSAERALLLVAIARAQIESGDRVAAGATLDQALAAAETIQDEAGRMVALSGIADVALKLGDRALAAAAGAGIEQPGVRAAGLIALAKAHAAAGDPAAAAAAAFGQAVAVAGSLEAEVRRAGMMAIVAEAQARSGDQAAAAATVALALAELRPPPEPSELLGMAYAKIAWAQAAAGDGPAAAASFAKARETLASIAHEGVRRIGLLAVAEMQRDAGDAAAAARTLQEAAALAAAIGDAGERDRALMHLAAAQAGVRLFAAFPHGALGGLLEADRATLPDALAAAMLSLGGTRRTAAGLGAAPPAQPWDLDRALDTALSIDDPLVRFAALTFVAAPALTAGDRPEALLTALVSAEQALLEGGETAAPPADFDWANLVLLYVAAGETDGPLAVATNMVQRGGPPYLLACVAWAQAEMGDKAAAESALNDLLASSMDRMVVEIRDGMRAYLAALVQANIGDLAGALASAERIPGLRTRTDLLVAIAARKPPPEYLKLVLMDFSE